MSVLNRGQWTGRDLTNVLGVLTGALQLRRVVASREFFLLAGESVLILMSIEELWFLSTDL